MDPTANHKPPTASWAAAGGFSVPLEITHRGGKFSLHSREGPSPMWGEGAPKGRHSASGRTTVPGVRRTPQGRIGGYSNIPVGGGRQARPPAAHDQTMPLRMSGSGAGAGCVPRMRAGQERKSSVLGSPAIFGGFQGGRPTARRKRGLCACKAALGGLLPGASLGTFCAGRKCPAGGKVLTSRVPLSDSTKTGLDFLLVYVYDNNCKLRSTAVRRDPGA